jgi:hypothetical protein
MLCCLKLIFAPALSAIYSFLHVFFLQLKSSLLLHIDGTSPVAEDISRQVP